MGRPKAGLGLRRPEAAERHGSWHVFAYFCRAAKVGRRPGAGARGNEQKPPALRPQGARREISCLLAILIKQLNSCGASA